ncbi:hypothetical protein RV09_GL001874 [Enterococcus moraviensis]|nr:hypothetical protein RV09_GL001874 [Enterococcus moraviensis]
MIVLILAIIYKDVNKSELIVLVKKSMSYFRSFLRFIETENDLF